jgi:hypothetical protein
MSVVSVETLPGFYRRAPLMSATWNSRKDILLSRTQMRSGCMSREKREAGVRALPLSRFNFTFYAGKGSHCEEETTMQSSEYILKKDCRASRSSDPKKQLKCSKKIPLDPPFLKGEVFELPPLQKESWGGF